MSEKAKQPIPTATLREVLGGYYSYPSYGRVNTPGTQGHDSIEATGAAQSVNAGAGHDTVEGSQGDDLVVGADGNDRVRGDGGNDLLYGNAGQDIVLGGVGVDTVYGGTGDDSLAGGAGDDLVRGDDGKDSVFWHPGDGNDTVFGGKGTDTLVLEDTGLSLRQLLDLIDPGDGSAEPKMRDGYIDLKGVSGSITLNGETIHFSEMERLRVAGYTHLEGR